MISPFRKIKTIAQISEFTVNFFRNCDVHKLLRRLDVLIKTRPSTVLEDVSESEICQYLSCLVECYFLCSESIKLSRAIEKVMFCMLCARKGTLHFGKGWGDCTGASLASLYAISDTEIDYKQYFDLILGCIYS